MKLLTRLVVLFYVTFILFLCSFVLLYILNLIPFESVMDFLYVTYYDEQMRMLMAVVSFILLFTNFMLYRLFSVKMEKGKTIAFDNLSGRVSVSLFAIEDLIKRVVGNLSEIKEARPAILANKKKGLQIQIHLILRSEVNIPEITSRIQDLVKRKIQDIVGLDEPVSVTIHISKIVFDQSKEKRKDKDDEGKSQLNYPFQGYRA